MSRISARYLWTILVIAGLASHAWASTFRMIALPDTQFYSESYPATFVTQTTWIKANVTNLNIAFVTQLGDIVNASSQTYQWDNARQAMQILNGVVPYGVCLGNHDLGTTNFTTYFGASYFQNYSWYGGASPDGLGSWQRVFAGGYDLMFIHLPFDAQNQDLTWAASVMAQNKWVPTILVTHDYMDAATREQTPWIPGYNSPETIWNNLIRGNDQIFAVMAGHYYSYQYNQTSINNAGRKVYEMMSDYQSDPNGGNGWLRILTFDTQAGTMDVKTYSPTLDGYRTDARNQFAISLDINHRFAPDTTLRLLRPQVISDFNADDTRDGWVRNNSSDGYTGPNPQGDANSTLVRQSDADGRGYLYYTEPGAGKLDYFVAPAKFVGDLSDYDAITFDYRVYTPSGTPNPTYVRLYDGTEYYQWLNTERVFNNGQWQRLVASLKDPDLWVAGGGATASFSNFIKNITEVRVCADLMSTSGMNALDDFALADYETIPARVAASTFDTSTDGWSFAGSGALSLDVHGFATGTHPSSTGGSWYFNAPVKFLGDKSTCYGGEIQYDLKQTQVDNQFDGTDVTLTGAGITLQMNLPSTSHPDSTWTNYRFVLTEDAGWVKQSTGLAPTGDEFRSVLSNLSELRIRGGFRQGVNSACLDNVVMTSISTLSSIPVSRIAQLSGLSDGTTVSLTSAKAATAASNTFADGSYYVEEPNRTSGVRVVPDPGLQSVVRGDRVRGLGTVRTDAHGEQYVSLTSITVDPGDQLQPLGLVNKSIGSALPPTGALVKVFGKLVYSEPVTFPDKPSYVYIDDGSGLSVGSHRGIKIDLTGQSAPITKDLNGTQLVVTGILGRALDGLALIPVIHPRDDSDITVF